MEKYAKIYNFYENLFARVLRYLIIILLSVFVSFSFINHTFPKLELFLLSVFIMFEIFLELKIARINPKINVFSAKKPLDSFTLAAMASFGKSSSKAIVKGLLKKQQILFMLKKADIKEKEMEFIDIDKKELSEYSLELAKTLKGEYVTTMDIFAAYIILSEDKTKLLFNKNLKKDEFLHILYWARTGFAYEEIKKPIRANFSGQGIAEDWVFGWTIETKKYMNDITAQALSKKPMFLGRGEELAQTLEALYKGDGVILVGEPGCGKESIVETIAYQSFDGTLAGNLYHQRFFQLMVDSFLAGAQNQGEFEERLDAVIAEIAHAGDVIVYVPDFEAILGGSTFGIDLSGAIIPYVQKGVLRMIGSVTPQVYKKFVEPRTTLLDVFKGIKFDEPSKDVALLMLFKKAFEIEQKYKLALTYRAVIAAYDYSSKYSKEKVLPGSAVDLLDDTSNSVRLSGGKTVEEQDVVLEVERKTKIPVGAPKKEEKELLLNLEQELHERIIGQDEAVSSVSESMRRLRTGLSESKKPVSFLFLGPTGVGKTETAKALSFIYFKSEEAMLRFDMSEYKGEEGIKRLLGSAPGEGDERGEIEKVYDNPFSLILLDEFEKADPKILDLFLQVLDDGRLTDNKGKTISFSSAIIIATSNAGSEFIREEVQKGTVIDKKFKTSLLDYLQKQGLFKPELLNRFDDIITFKPLDRDEVLEISKLMLSKVVKTMEEKDIDVDFDNKIMEKIANEGFDKEFGARPLRRYIQDNIEDLMAQKILKDEIKRGDKITVTTDSSNNLLIESQNSS